MTARSSVLPSLSSVMCSIPVIVSQPEGTPGTKPVIPNVLVAFPNPSMRAVPQSRSGGQSMLFRMPNEARTLASNSTICAATAGTAAPNDPSMARLTRTSRRVASSAPFVVGLRRRYADALARASMISLIRAEISEIPEYDRRPGARSDGARQCADRRRSRQLPPAGPAAARTGGVRRRRRGGRRRVGPESGGRLSAGRGAARRAAARHERLRASPIDRARASPAPGRPPDVEPRARRTTAPHCAVAASSPRASSARRGSGPRSRGTA